MHDREREAAILAINPRVARQIARDFDSLTTHDHEEAHRHGYRGAAVRRQQRANRYLAYVAGKYPCRAATIFFLVGVGRLG